MFIFRYSFFVIAFLVTAFSVSSASAQFLCLPNCNVNDGRFFVLVGSGTSSLNNSTMEFGLASPAESSSFQFGVFDGNSDGRWDSAVNFTEITFAIFADPLGNGSGNIQIAEFSGNDMADNDWSDFDIPNNIQARAEDGSFSYKLVVTNLDPSITARNTFKVRSTGGLFLLPNQPFNLIANMATIEDIQTIYPSFDPFSPDPSCIDDPDNPILLCDEGDPSCCLNDTTYDGVWTFFFEVPEDLSTLQIWNGDFDFGSSFADLGLNCFADGVDVDTNDLNTPDDVLPPWAIGTTAVFEGLSAPANPFDDICNPLFRRKPSVVYTLTDPLGNVYRDENPSGTEEWELFSISTDEPFDASINDLQVDDIPPGVWRVEILGTDLGNLNALRFPFALLGVNPDGEMPTEVNVPTITQWGVLIVTFSLGIIGVLAIKRRKIKT